jgi:hypothetical protein
MTYPAPDHTEQIRQRVKRWINEFDLKHLYPDYKPEIESIAFRQDYAERPEFSAAEDPETDEGAQPLT